MKIAFYRAEQGDTWDKAIAEWTHGPYSHVEAIFEDITSQIPVWLIHPHDPPERSAVCFSSSPRDGGVRFKHVDVTDGKWDVVSVDWDEAAILPTAGHMIGMDYDWKGIRGFVITLGQHDPLARFCSEAVVNLGQANAKLMDKVPWRVSPNELHKLVA